MELLYIYYCAVFYLGTIIGSFLNVVTLDLQKLFTENSLEERNEFSFFARHWTKRYFWRSLLSRRSHCDSCNKTLGTFELFPIFSFVLQKGQCTNCHAKIDPDHLYVEIASGVMFLGIFQVLLWNAQLLSGSFVLTVLFWFTVFSLLFVLALFDYRTQLVPDIVLSGAGILLFVNTIYDLGVGFVIPDWTLYGAAVLFAALFFTLWGLSRGRWIGFADGKIAILIGLLFGLSQGFTVLAIAFWAGAAVSLLLLGIQKFFTDNSALTLGSAVPFGPYLVFAIWFVFVTDINLFGIVW